MPNYIKKYHIIIFHMDMILHHNDCFLQMTWGMLPYIAVSLGGNWGGWSRELDLDPSHDHDDDVDSDGDDEDDDD